MKYSKAFKNTKMKAIYKRRKINGRTPKTPTPLPVRITYKLLTVVDNFIEDFDG